MTAIALIVENRTLPYVRRDEKTRRRRSHLPGDLTYYYSTRKTEFSGAACHTVELMRRSFP